MTAGISGRTRVVGVAGSPVSHSISPLIHNAWIAAAGIDAVYVAFAPPADGFARFAEGLRGGAVRGLNVTAPFKGAALAVADRASARAAAAGAANLLIFEADGSIGADNTDGEGLLAAFADQAPGFDPAAGPLVLIGAGGAARAAAAAFLAAGAPAIRIINRSAAAADALAAALGPRVSVTAPEAAASATAGANAIVNATPVHPGVSLGSAPAGATVMDMAYRPLDTALLRAARARGLRAVDGLAMLIGQARPSFAALFGRSPPDIDVRRLALAALAADP
ncbi:MAG: shikimate dehydrogenase family protein [Caulobacteraceae bacterium]